MDSTGSTCNYESADNMLKYCMLYDDFASDKKDINGHMVTENDGTLQATQILFSCTTHF